MNFVHDALSDGQRFRILAVVNDRKESLRLVAHTSLPGGRGIRELETLRSARKMS
ncbi:MAG: hypothetical protein KA171_02030 [Reyranella sp.]|nr:hypothetical protein [Reyranella sp.]